MKLDLSVVVPVYNETENIKPLYERLIAALKSTGQTYEMLFIDDGSTDNSPEILKEIAHADKHVKVVSFRRNYGQTAALSAGFHYAEGEIIIAMDSDLQNDPADIPKLLSKMEEGYDLVSGWRKNRHDAFVTRKIPSYIANKIISGVENVPIQDFGCTLKAYRKPFVKGMRLFGEMHRFIPIYAYWMGARITEIPVNHSPRSHGQSKYGLMRAFKVLLDMVTVKFLGSFSTKPIYVFGGVGLACLSMGTLTAFLTLIEKIFYGIWVHRNPVLLISIFFFLVGFQCILMGLLAEIVIRIYHESRNQPTYWIQKTINL